MGLIYEKLVRPLAFRRDPESVHERVVGALSVLGHLPPVCRLLEWWNGLPASARKPVECAGLQFPNRVGLAAGFDKDAHCWPAMAALGFGHVEIGTVTRQAQPGNPQPRLFRFPAEEAVLNRMGFNNAGAAAMARRLAGQPPRGRRRIPLGINLGKTKVAALDQAVEDYLGSFALLAEHADYIAINVSSPNTPDLRKLQEHDRLVELLGALQNANTEREAAAMGGRRPIFLKIAPDLTWPQIDDILQILHDLRLDGIIATNTTLARPGPFAAVDQAGGLSGRPLCRRSTEIINYIARATSGRLPIIGVGGITDAASAGEKLDAGATLVQVYSGWIYRGPFFAAELARALAGC
ncbi:MAG TPA: quinone-dependent dihydroorotate dehydrogenase [Opitutaceae bacterium]|nr:quinone-dependent dihydroorotate dehydrogenase [Opitutaceae bacterium]